MTAQLESASVQHLSSHFMIQFCMNTLFRCLGARSHGEVPSPGSHGYLGIIVTLILNSIALQSCTTQISPCHIQTEEARSISVQSNEPIYNEIFGNQECSPQKLVLRIPVNSRQEITDTKSLLNQRYTPKIVTLLTFSHQAKSFYIRRIDNHNDGWIYKKASCLAWKWSREDEQQVLNLSLDRNLQIRDPKIKSVIFIVSLPFEIKDAQTNVNLQVYTWDIFEGIYYLKLKNYPNLKEILIQKDRRSSQASNAFRDGKTVKPEIQKELNQIDDIGGVNLDKYFESILDGEYLKKYIPSSEDTYCEIPDDLKKL
ncbi:hypothetical protein BJP36_06800 [Moorena producens JHB]|uniref:Uncharacterized protein n=1 Tax=Moorena producens (strain JHB) TaxID=1454205 RepID=A0A1D9FWI9_MOOP1|nr:hypothetical protein [Moorena producens]AOY79675.1 hypothetical protein BJP36_06800 [Moorena producens JHB]